MTMRRTVAIGWFLLAGALVLADQRSKLAEVHVAPGARPKCSKILVLGISDDRETRHRFEDKFVTQLRGRDVAALTSYPLVEDLTRPESRDVILAALEREKVDAVLTVRAVPIDGVSEADWSKTWTAWLDAPATIRELVQQSVPVSAKAAKRYGVEISLWQLGSGKRTWSARTIVFERKKLRDAASDLMQETIALLRELEIV